MARQFDFSMVPTPILDRIIEVGGDLGALAPEEFAEVVASQEELGPFGAGLEQAESALSTAFAAGAQELGFEEAAQAGLRQAEEARSEVQRRYRPSVPSIIDRFSEEGVLSGIAALPEFAYEQLLYSAPQLGAQLGAGILGTLAGGPVVGGVAATAVGTPFFAGQNIQRQMEESGAALEDVETGKAVLTGVGQSALDAVIGRYLGVFGPARGAEELAKVAQRGIANRVTRAAGKGAAVEAPTEALQQALEIAQVDYSTFFDRVSSDPSLRKELYESLIAGGLVGGVITAPTGIIKPADPAIAVNQDLEAHMREESEETARMNQFAEEFDKAESARAELDRSVFAGDEKLRYQDELMAQGIDPLTAEEAVIDEDRTTINENQAIAAGMEPPPQAIEGELLDVEVPEERMRLESPPIEGEVIEREIDKSLPKQEGSSPYFTEDGVFVSSRPTIYAEPESERARPSETIRVTPEGEAITGPQVKQPSIDLAVNPFQDAEVNRLFDMLTAQETSNNASAASRTRKRLVDRLKAIGLGDQRISAILATTPSERGQTRLFSKKVSDQKAEAVRELAKRSVTLPQLAEFRTKLNRVSAALGKVLKGMGLGDVALRLDRVVRDPQGQMTEGVTETNSAGNILIALSTQIYDPNLTDEQLTARIREVMNHEVIHALRNLGVLTDAEYRSLVDAAKKQKYVDRNGKERLFTYFDRAKQMYKDDDLVIQEEEAVAELFRDWAAGRKKIAGKPVSLFKKIINFFKRLGGAMSDNDINSPEQIFEGIMSGRIGSRERAQQGEPMRMFSRAAQDGQPAFYSATEQQIQDAIRAYSYPLGTIGYAVRMPIDQFMRLTYGMGPLGSDDVVRTAKEFLEQMPSNDGSLFVRPERTRGEMSRDSFTRFDPDAVDRQNQRGIPMLILGMDEETGALRVNNHEGRHRTALAAIDGATTIPVIVQYSQPYRKFDSDRLDGNIPRTQEFNYDELTASRRVAQQFFGVDTGRDERSSSYFEGSIPKGVPLDYGFENQLSEVIGPKSDPLGEESAIAQNGERMFSRRSTPDIGINVRYDSGSNIDYAQEIVSGRKSLETRNTDSLRPYVGRRVGIVSTGRGKAKAIGSAIVGEPIVANEAEFEQARSQHLVPRGSEFDIQPGSTKFMYPMEDPREFEQPLDVGQGIVARKIILPDSESRQFSRRPVNAPKAESNPFDVRLDRTIVPVYPESYEELNKKKEPVVKHRLTGDTQFKPNSVGLLSAAQWIQDRIRNATGIGTEPVPYTDENIDELGRLMATEALKALEQDNNAIGWYDEQMTRSKKILSVIEPRIFENDTNESAFDWALAVTSNGQAVPDNFDLALQAFRFYLQNGKLPDTKKAWNKGGDRATAMRNSFNFFNQYQDMYQRGEVQMPVYEFLDADFSVKELQSIVRDMNGEFGTDISVPSGELAETMVKGSFLAGPKIGQGFYQNLRGNFDPLTMDIWWMRMWNRMVNRPFKPETPKSVVDTKRKSAKQVIAEQAQEDQAMRIILGLDEFTFPGKKQKFKGALTETGLRMSDLRKNDTFDEFVPAFNKAWNRYYTAHRDAYGRPPEKPQIYNDMAVLEEDIYGALQATPANGTERAYMRAVTSRAKELLRSQGVDINTADLQALLWYPEKRLFEALGVRKGQGQDTDYAESALGQAKKEGITDDRIEEALSDPDSGRVRAGADAARNVPITDQATGASRRYSKRPDVSKAREIAARAGTRGRIWNESGDRGQVLGLPVVAGYSVSDTYKGEYDALGISSPDIFEMESSPDSAELFRAAITKSKNESPYGAAVFVYTPQEYEGMRLFLTDDGQAGFALKGDDIVSVFNSQSSPYRLVSVPSIRLAIELGGRMLDAYDTVLPPVYSLNGMKSVARLKWDDEFAPSDWSKDTFMEYNNGEPDVVYMVYDDQSGVYKKGDGTYVSTPEQAEEIQDKSKIRFSRRYSATAPDIATPEDIIDRMVGQKPPTKLMALFNKYILGAREGENGQTAFMRNFINKFEPLFQIDNFLNGKLENFDPADSVGRAAELSQGVTGRAYHMLTSGALRFNKETGEPEYIDSPDNKGLEEIFAPIGDKFQREYSAYAMARRELKLRAQGRRGFVKESYEDMVKLVADLEAKHPFFKDVHADYQRFNSYMVDFAKDAGVLDEQMAKEFQNMDYVPFYRLSDVDANTSEMDKALSSKAAKALKNVKGQNPFDTALEGGEEAVGDLYMNVAKNAEFIVMSSLKNFALQKTANALEKANGLGFTSWGRKATADDRGEIVTFYEDGVEQRYKISDPSVWAALASLDETKKSGWVNALAAVAGVFRTGITIAPSYMAANLIRGKVDAYVRTGVPLASFNETFKKTRDAFKDSDQARQLQLSTGMGGYTYGQSAESIGNTLKRNARIKSEEGGPVLRRIGDTFVNIVKSLEKAGEATEMAERLVLMDRLMEQGVSRREASYRAMNLINYGRRGAGGGAVADALINVLIPTVPFLNARIQGLYKFAEDPRVGGGATTQALVEMYGRGLMITAISATLAGIAMQDERWDDEPLYEKVGNDIFYIGDYKVRIPRAFEVGAIFGTMPVLTIDAIRQRDGDDLAAGMVSILTNTFAFNPIPQGIKPVIEVATNTNFFKGGELANVAIQRLPTELQARPDTPQLYKFLSQYGGAALAGLSPIEIQQIVEGYTGSLGAQLIATADVLLADTSRPSGAFGTIGDVTGFSRFLKQRGEGGSKTLGEFYELKREIDQFHAGLQEMARSGQTEIVQQMLEDKGKSLGYRKQFGAVSRRLSEVNRAIRAVMNQDIPADVKSERVRALREQKAELTRQVVKAAKESGYFD